ncbi:MAG: M56 family metallopeptidase [Sedimentisphaerales bacterium]|nr:M56 family metallopeptidase [Sedimentisphaerales bacterium]
MDPLNSTVMVLNKWGPVFCDYAGRMLVQSSVLVALLLAADLCLRGWVCARFRYAMWLLVPVKLVLPPSLALPTGAMYWLSDHLPVVSTVPRPPGPVVSVAAMGDFEPFGNIVATPSGAAEIATAGSQMATLQWPGLVLLGWMVGVLLLIALVLWRVLSVRRSLYRSRPAGRQMVALLQECRADLGITTPVTLRRTEDMHSPAVCGFLRPVVLLPTALPPGLGPEGLRTILTHEMTHIKRRDPWVSLAQTALQVAYFWHPLVWAANARLRHLREMAVDETVVACHSQAECYTNTLIDIAQMAFRKPAFSLRLIGIAESRRALERRITHMLNRKISRRPALGLSGLLTIIAIGAVLVPMGRASRTARAEQDAMQSVPALPEGIAEMFQLRKDDILERFGKPEHVFYGDNRYTLDDLPETYFLPYEEISFCVHEDAVVGITLLSPRYVFGNGIRVGDSEEKVKQAFGPPSDFKETDFKDFLVYDQIGLSFEVNKQDRSVMEINIKQDYGDPTQFQAYARAAEFEAQLPQKIARLNIDSANLKKVIATFGQPLKYIWGPKTLPPDDLPRRFIAIYPGRFHVFMVDDHIVELRHEHGSKYIFAGKLRVGSTLEEALAVLGPPAKTVVGEEIDWQNSKDVLFKDIERNKGHCYYHRPDRNVRVWFGNYKVAGIYMTRSDYGEDEPFDKEFAARLSARIRALDIDAADREGVLELFGDPIQYVWGEKTFTPDALPENYIMSYPCAFSVWLKNNRIMEIRHGRGSQYAYGGTLRIGATVQEALDVLGPPDATVTGKNEYKDRILYRDIDGNKGHCYYHRADQKVRVWFSKNKVIAVYMTRSDFPTH